MIGPGSDKYVLKESLALIEVESIAVEFTSCSLLCLVCYL